MPTPTIQEAEADFAAQRKALLEEMKRGGVDDRAAGAEPLLRDAIAITTRAAESRDLAALATRFGGAPDVPAGHARPSTEFLGQIALADLAPFDARRRLPGEGLLSFWLAIVDDETIEGRVEHFADASAMTQGEASPEQPLGLDFAAEVVLPPDRSNVWPLDPPYGRFFAADAARRRLSRPGASGMFLYDRPDERIANVGELVLLRIDSADRFYFGFDEAVCLYFVISEEALAARDFARVRAVLGASL